MDIDYNLDGWSYPQTARIIGEPIQLFVGGGNKYTNDPGGKITYGIKVQSILTKKEIEDCGRSREWFINDWTFFNTPAKQFKEHFGIDDQRYNELKARFEELCSQKTI